jgi:flagellin
MSTVINTNLASLYAQNNLSNAQNNLATSVMRLSSGLRINSAKDDAAGLAISQDMRAQLNGINQSRRNLNDATNLLQVADTSLSTIHDMLLRMKQLATQGYNGSLDGRQKADLMDEIVTLNTEINNTATRTKYNGNELLAAASFQSTSSTLKNGTSFGGVGISDVKVGGIDGTFTISAYTAGDDELTIGNGTLSETISFVGGVAANSSKTLDFGTLGISLKLSNGTASAITSDTIGAAIDLGTIIVSSDGSRSLDFMAGSDTGIENLISYSTMNVQTNSSNDGSEIPMTTLGTLIGTMSAYSNATAVETWQADFNSLGTNIDSAIQHISDKRSYVGSLSNRISYINTNLESQSTNMQASLSAIIDTDFAAETAKLTKGQIMQQAATAMLAQANQMPNVVLSLLK